MADRFWVGGGSSTNWNATGNTNWSASSGGANNASVPGVSDVAKFDANSGIGNAVISATITLQGLNCTGYAGTITHNASVTLSINTASVASLLLSAAMTYTAAAVTSVIAFIHTSGTADITTNGERLGALTINGAGGTTRLLDAIRVDAAATSVLTLTSGAFNANGFDVTANLVNISGATTRTLTMGAGTWYLGAAVATANTIWSANTITNLTFNKNTANIVIQSNALAISRTFAGGTLTYNTITINANSTKGVVSFTGASIFASLVVGAGNILIFASTTLTIAAITVSSGTAGDPALFMSSNVGTIATVSVASGTVTFDYAGFRDMTFTGGAAFSATNSFDYGNVTGITINTPSGGGGASAADIADAVWDELTSGHSVSGSFAKLLVDNINAALSSLATQTSVNTLAGYVDTEVAAIKAKTDNLPSDPADASVVAGLIAALEAKVDIVDTNVDAILVDTGTDIPATLTSINAKTTNLPSDPADQSIIIAATDAILAAVADVPTNAELTTALSSLATQTSVNTLAGYVDTEVAAIKAKTDNLPSDPADASDVAASFSAVNSTLSTIAGYIDTEIGDIRNRLPAALVGGRMDASVGAMEANVMTAAAAASDLTTELQSGLATASDLATAITAIGDIPTNAELATALGDLPTNAELTAALSGFSTQASVDAVAVQVGEIWQLEGLDSANVLTVTPTARTVDAIVQAIAGDPETSVTVTRAP